MAVSGNRGFDCGAPTLSNFEEKEILKKRRLQQRLVLFPSPSLDWTL